MEPEARVQRWLLVPDLIQREREVKKEVGLQASSAGRKGRLERAESYEGLKHCPPRAYLGVGRVRQAGQGLGQERFNFQPSNSCWSRAFGDSEYCFLASPQAAGSLQWRSSNLWFPVISLGSV